VKKFIARTCLLILIILIVVVIQTYSTHADAYQQEWCKDKYEKLFLLYDGQLKNKLTQKEIDELLHDLDSYFLAYEKTFGRKWNSGVVIWEMFMIKEADQVSLALTEEAIDKYNAKYGRAYKLGADNQQETIGDTFLMQKYLLENTTKLNPLKLCKTWEELN